ncbi:DUF572-domain-containing protein [Clavulina sp. PMI_390]|nr:DUF572-domain-containing protein [Clavulina sp. PMI_390]
MVKSAVLFAAILAGAVNALVPPYHLSRRVDDLQSSPDLDPSQIQPGLASDGQETPEAGQVPSLTSNNNFINFCATQTGVPLTNGEQIKTGSCNPTIVDSTGTVIGHSHIVVEQMTSLSQTTVTNPNVFAFFKGLNAAAVNGQLSAEVTGGLDAGVYRIASINTCSNHQPVMMAVAQHGSVDDMIYITVSGNGAATGAGATTTTTSATVESTSVASTSTTTSAAAASSSPAALATGSGANLQTFTGAAGGISAGTVFGPGSDGRFTVTGQSGTFATAQAAVQRSCDVQHNACADKANQTGDLADLNQNTCQAQLTSCSAAATKVNVATPATNNLQVFTGVAGGTEAPAVSSNGSGGFVSQGQTFPTKLAALQNSCTVQSTACKAQADKTGDLGSLNQTTCADQLAACNTAAGKAQGFNRYFPPDFDPQKHVTLNTYHGKHALGDRARKIDKGILITRFELPFNIWCGTCNNHIGMGVRYNAEKKKVGNYYSTPIYSFRCKCHLCSGWFEIRTDPKNTQYVVVEGARKQEQDWDPEENGGFAPHETDPKPGFSTGGDAMGSLEKTAAAEENMTKVVQPRLTMLTDLSERRNADPYTLSKTLRSTLRVAKKAEKRAKEEEDSVRNKFSLPNDLALVKEDEVREEAHEEWKKAREAFKLEDDVRRKTFQSQHGSLGLNHKVRSVSSSSVSSSKRSARSTSTPSNAKATLAATLLRNTQRRLDPFAPSSSQAPR